MQKIMVKDLMSHEVITLEKNETIDLAEEIMRLARIRHLPVVDRGRLVGLVTHRDLLRAQVSLFDELEGDDEHSSGSCEIIVAEIANEHVVSVTPETWAVDAAKLMLQRKYGCLPVVSNSEELVGIITEADFLELAIKALDQS